MQTRSETPGSVRQFLTQAAGLASMACAVLLALPAAQAQSQIKPPQAQA